MIKNAGDKSYIRVFVDELAVDVRIGLHPWEKKPQRLLVNVSLYGDPATYLSEANTKTIFDYDRIRNTVREWPGRAHTDLVETYARELIEVAFSFKKVEAALVSINKADVFPDAKGAGVEVFMTRKDFKKLK